MTSYNFNDSSMDETFVPEKNEDPRWNVGLNMSFEHLNLTDEQLRELHDLFATTLNGAELILQRED